MRQLFLFRRVKSRTLFVNKVTGEYAYLPDRLMGFEKRELITEDAYARIKTYDVALRDM